MKRRILSGVLVVVMSMCLAACGGNDVEEPEQKEETVEQIVVDNTKEEESEDVETEVVETETVMYISYSEDAMTFMTEEIVVTSADPEIIIKELCNRKVMGENVEVLNFTIEELEGQKVINLDMNSAFEEYIMTMGSTGEYYILGGLCNSFLQTFECDKIKITVEGNVLSTGHNEYSEYMSIFK